MINYTLFILGNGRKPYLERTIHSWEMNLIGKPKHQIIFDDSGDEEYRAYLNKKFGNRYVIVPIGDKPMGQVYAINFIYKYLKDVDADYIFELEEDWVLFRKLDISKLINILEQDENITQVRVPRTITSTHDMKYGSTISFQLNEPTAKHRFVSHKDGGWYEVRGRLYFWSHNPSIYRKSMINHTYPESGATDHEYTFGIQLFNENKKYKAAYYASNMYDAYIEHIGLHDQDLLNYANEFDIFSNTI